MKQYKLNLQRYKLLLKHNKKICKICDQYFRINDEIISTCDGRNIVHKKCYEATEYG